MKKKMRISVIVLLALIVGFILLYNFATSQYCIKKFILPVVAEKTNSKISVGNIEVSPMQSSVMISDLAYSSSEASMHSEKLIIKSSIYDLLFNHKINVKKVLLQNTTVKIDLTPKADIKPISDATNDDKTVADVETQKKRSKPYKISLNDVKIDKLNLVVKNSDKVTKLSNFNLNIPNIEPNKKCTINIDGNIAMSDGKRLAEGFIKSKSIVVINNNFIPTEINSASLLNLDGHKMPLTVKLITNKDGSFKFSSNISDIMIQPFASSFLTGPYSNTKGGIDNVNIEASGKDINDFVANVNPIESSLKVSGINISSENNFYIKNKTIKAEFDLSALMKGEVLPNKLNIYGLNAQYMSKGQNIKIDSLNLGINKKGKNELKAILNTGFDYLKGRKKLNGTLAGNIIVTGINALNPENINSTLNLHLNGYDMPILVKYENNINLEKANLSIENFNFDSVKDFINTSGSKLSGSFANLNIVLSGKGIDSLKKGFQKGSNLDIAATISAKKLKVSDKGKYSADIPDINTSLELNQILNQKYYINSLKVDNPSIILIKKKKTEAPAKKQVVFTPVKPTKEAASADLKKKPVNVDFDLKNIDINNLRAEIISDKKLILSNVNIRSNEIKANTPGNVDVSLNYVIDNKLKGTLKANNSILVTSALVPEIFKSQLELIYGKNKSISNIDLKCKQPSNGQVPFILSADVKDLLLDPILMAFVPQPYNTTKTNINNLNINLKGQNLYDIKTTEGSVKSDLSNISIPINIKEENIVDVMFFPLKMIAELSSNTALRFVSGDVANAMIKIDNMFNEKKRIDLKNGKLNIGLNSGLINIKEFDFYGIPQSPVEEISANGSINLNNKAINLRTNTLFAGLKIPLDVSGTIDKPKTNTANMTAQILQNNSQMFIKTGLDVTNTVNETLDKIKNKNFDELLKSSTDQNGQQQGSAVEQLLNSVIQRQPQQQQNTQSQPRQSEPQQQSKRNDTVNQIFGIINKIGKQNQNSSGDAKEQNQSSGNVDDQIKNLLNF
jgi:hypothetical protein